MRENSIFKKSDYCPPFYSVTNTAEFVPSHVHEVKKEASLDLILVANITNMSTFCPKYTAEPRGLEQENILTNPILVADIKRT